MSRSQMQEARARRLAVGGKGGEAPATPSKPPVAPSKAEGRSFGFGEELAPEVELEKLLGHNFIDDGGLLREDEEDPAGQIRATLGKMDGLALGVRAGLNALVREGVGLVENAQYVNLGEGSGIVSGMKPVLGRLLTAYTELVSGLQKARESIGYDVEGPSVTSVPDEGEMQERITRDFGRRTTRRYT